MNFKIGSQSWFNNHYHEDIYGYFERRFFPIVCKYMGEVKGVVLNARCGFGNPYLEKLRLNNSIGIDIDLLLRTETNYIKNLAA